MHQTLLSILRCPYCGSRLRREPVRPRGGSPAAAILACYCCAFPVVDGIVVMAAGPVIERAVEHARAGRGENALLHLLELQAGNDRRARSRAELTRLRRASFGESVRQLVPGAEGDYLLHRFSDPTFLRTRTLARAVWAAVGRRGRAILDLCGGAGHLSHFLGRLPGAPPVVLADRSFCKLWLARRLLPAGTLIVCCDAEHPLPFGDAAFGLSVCSDAFHYIWQKRLLAGELQRVTRGDDGAVLLAHLHNALGWNYAQGVALPPQGYRELFGGMRTRLLREADVRFDLPGVNEVDLRSERSAPALARSPALSLVAARSARVFRRRQVRSEYPTAASINPLYRPGTNGDATTWRLTFPSPEYADEYAECARYLPPQVQLASRGSSAAALPPRRRRELARRGVLLELPENYT